MGSPLLMTDALEIGVDAALARWEGERNVHTARALRRAYLRWQAAKVGAGEQPHIACRTCEGRGDVRGVRPVGWHPGLDVAREPCPAECLSGAERCSYCGTAPATVVSADDPHDCYCRPCAVEQSR